MASTSSYLFDDTVDGEIETLSIYNCVFCNKLLDGKSKLLDCLHVICNDCVKKKLDKSGLKCKCLTITKAPDIDYSIVSPNISMVKICDDTTCDSVATRICIFCNCYYCKPCSKVHPSSKSHNPDLMLSYPMKKDFVLCTCCSEKCVEICCTKCSVIICSLCHLTYHRMHAYKVLDVLVKEAKSSLLEVLAELKKDTKATNVYYGEIKESQRLMLEKQKESIFLKIDEVMQKLHDELDDRSHQLKQSYVNNYNHSDSKINKSRQMILDIEEKNKSYIESVKTALENPTSCNLIRLKDKIHLGENSAMSLSGELSNGLNIDFLNSDCDEAVLENYVAAIEDVGNITEISSMSVSSLAETNGIETNGIKTPSNKFQNFINLQATVLNDNRIVKEEILNTGNGTITSTITGITTSTSPSNSIITISSDESELSDYKEFDQCSCCNQLDYDMVHCSSCDRKYHHDCHIPVLHQNMNDINPLQTPWKCTLCQDVTRYVRVINQKDINGVIAVSEARRVIMMRILFELYCQNFDSEHFRELPDKVYRQYYQKVTSPISLNIVKNNLESDGYTCLIQFLKDIKRVFSNGLLYYPPQDIIYRSAANLMKYLYRLMNNWIPELDEQFIS